MPEQTNSEYEQKKAFFSRVLTVYGRKPALEALQDSELEIHALHLAHSNREAGIVSQLKAQAEARGVPVHSHSREQLSRISKNNKQDQGVAVDVICPRFQTVTEFLSRGSQTARILALDGIHNPQNLGMIIRSAAAGNLDGILIPTRGNASLGSLVIKASAGTLFRAPVLSASALLPALADCKARGAEICILDASGTTTLFDHQPQAFCVYVLGNESQGVSSEVAALADTGLAIPMQNGVESLNVAVTASLIAFQPCFSPHLER